MNLTALEATGLQAACAQVRALARERGADVARVELVGLVPRRELARCEPSFLEWAGIDDDVTIEARLARQ
jgi:glutamate formiminotransferase